MGKANPIQKRLLFKKLLAKTVQPLAIPIVLTFSGTYLYPIQGITYFCTHPILWAYLFSILIPELILTSVVFVLFYTFLYPVQAGVALFFNGPSGLVTAWLALLHESSMAAQLISEIFLLPTPLRSLFDTVLSMEGLDEMVVAGRLRKRLDDSPIVRVKKFVKHTPKNLIFPLWTLKCAIKISLHFVPFFGPVCLVILEGPKHGRRMHRRYFELKGLNVKQEKAYISERRGQYMGFGMVAAGFESVPIMGLFFNFTNCVGAALWAANVEKTNINAARRSMRLGAKDAEEPGFQEGTKTQLW
jgi:uncharacterized protein involved in cysteine biosynthesis